MEEIRTLFIIFNIHAHVVSGKWKGSHVLMLLQFVAIEGMILFPLWIWCTLLWRIKNNIILTLRYFLTLIIGWGRIGKLKQITRNVLWIEVGDVQTDFITRWTFVILTVGPEGVLTMITITCRRGGVEYKYTDFYFLNSWYYKHNISLQDCWGNRKG